MIKGYSFFTLLLCVAMIVLSFNDSRSQTLAASPASIDQKTFNSEGKMSRIQWSWQLPSTVRKGFAGSRHANWFIEKMFRCDLAGKSVYRFYVSNRNLLDGDHYDNFLENSCLDLSEEGAVVTGKKLDSSVYRLNSATKIK